MKVVRTIANELSKVGRYSLTYTAAVGYTFAIPLTAFASYIVAKNGLTQYQISKIFDDTANAIFTLALIFGGCALVGLLLGLLYNRKDENYTSTLIADFIVSLIFFAIIIFLFYGPIGQSWTSISRISSSKF